MRAPAAPLPPALAPAAEDAVARHLRAAGLERHELPGEPARVLATSEFVADAIARRPEWLRDLVRDGELRRPADAEGSRIRIEAEIAAAPGEAEFMQVLRRTRVRETVRIAWRDIGGLARLEETLADLTALAERLIGVALARAEAEQRARFGIPRSASGAPQALVVLALGKLGSRELNFSSDVDLVLTYPEGGESDGPGQRLDNEQFFVRVARRLVHLLGERTDEGFVYRVDLRLRPFGAASALVASFDALEEYYQSFGRDWERFALIRARPIAGDPAAGEALLALLRPFVYRRYLDFSALESLREVKQQIAQDLRGKPSNPDEADVKRGRGGIRELEFVVQAFQLLRGSLHPRLREGTILELLPRLAEDRLLPGAVADELSAAYAMLRATENRLQAWRDEQTHSLPSGGPERLRLAAAMGYPDWESFSAELEHARARVRAHFEAVLGEPEPRESTTPQTAWARIWQGLDDAPSSTAALAEAGFADGTEALEHLRRLHDNYRTRTLGERGQRRIATLVGSLLREAAATGAPLATLARVLGVIESVLQRAAYLALLTERPVALRQLVRLCAASPWLTEHLSTHPQVFDELLDPRTLYEPPGRDELEGALATRLAGIPPGDTEREIDALRYFQQAAVLRVAAAEVAGAIPLMVVSDRLTEIAEVCLAQVLRFAWRDLSARHGVPGSPEAPTPFAIVAYGKLGGIELGYGSDLDLVFIHGGRGGGGQTSGGTDGRAAIDDGTFFARLGQRIIHWLATYTSAGRLYEVDPRLRPSGSAGLLVTGIDAFEAYQRDEAWTWEHQALVRARAVAGDPGLAERFAAVRRMVLLDRREPEKLRGDVREMRLRMQRELGSNSGRAFDLKQDPGGIADIEFLVQYGVLRWSDRLGPSLRFTDNVRLLDAFAANGLLAAEVASLLGDAYRAFRARVHELDLQGSETRIGADELAELRAGVQAAWRGWMG